MAFSLSLCCCVLSSSWVSTGPDGWAAGAQGQQSPRPRPQPGSLGCSPPPPPPPHRTGKTDLPVGGSKTGFWERPRNQSSPFAPQLELPPDSSGVPCFRIFNCDPQSYSKNRLKKKSMFSTDYKCYICFNFFFFWKI